jgi:hypothetical protein
MRMLVSCEEDRALQVMSWMWIVPSRMTEGEEKLVVTWANWLLLKGPVGRGLVEVVLGIMGEGSDIRYPPILISLFRPGRLLTLIPRRLSIVHGRAITRLQGIDIARVVVPMYRRQERDLRARGRRHGHFMVARGGTRGSSSTLDGGSAVHVFIHRRSRSHRRAIDSRSQKRNANGRKAHVSPAHLVKYDVA